VVSAECGDADRDHRLRGGARQGVRRVVFASSIHVTGFYPAGRPTSPTDPVRPDTWYGVSKVYGEAVGRLYADKHGLSVVCLRLGGFSPDPLGHPSFLSGWLSHGDAVRLFRAVVRPGHPLHPTAPSRPRGPRSACGTRGSVCHNGRRSRARTTGTRPRRNHRPARMCRADFRLSPG
jgi:NAD dependent epimerase/dehydratase family